MNHVLLQEAIKLNKERKRRKGWQKVVRVLSAGVVFCTTYALILPAITMNRDPICGAEAHEHTAQCYTQQQVVADQCLYGSHVHGDDCRDENGGLVCGYGEVILHSHNEFCYHGEELVCGLEERSQHIHNGDCYAQTAQLICDVAEISEHIHDESCQIPEPELVCPLTEGQYHIHSEHCVEESRNLVCGMEENEEHTHEDGCYETVVNYVCGLSETEPHVHGDDCYWAPAPACEGDVVVHTHGDDCYQIVESLVCQIPQVAEHIHGAACLNENGVLSCDMLQGVIHNHDESCFVLTGETCEVLSCELEEHVHEDACYPEDPAAETGSPYLCMMGVHTHGDDCYDENEVLICTIPEHTHEAACLVADLDMTADVETREMWEAELNKLSYTGVWAEDVLTIARSQLGYQESKQNVILDENGVLRGYTRYGEWYGDHYGDWCAMFVSFCLDYAGVKEFPLHSSCTLWIQLLEEQGLYRKAADYTPQPGDVIFFDWEQPAGQGDVDHVGLVAELIPATEETPARIMTIEGNSTEQVEYNTYHADDATIIGYGVLPVGGNRKLTYEGADYTVTVRFAPEAGIPENATLAVREIEPGTEEFDAYYNQSVEAIISQGAGGEDISFARFFDISFVDNGVEVEPAVPVSITIMYRDAITVTEEQNSQVVHFAEEGVEILTPDTSLTAEDATDEAAEQVDTFAFTQGSFSVTGTVVSARVASTATKVNPWEIDNTGNTMYVLYTQIGNKYYALSGTEDSRPVEITVSGNTINLPTNNTENLFWTFVDKPNDDTAYLYSPIKNVGTGRHLHPFNNGNNNQNITTGGAYDASLVVNNDTVKIRGANNNFVRFRNASDKAVPTANERDATSFYVAAVGNGGRSYNVWFDGTLGGMMSYYGARNENRPATAGEDGTAVVELPETWQSSTKYDYVLRGWYDIKNHTYYAVDPNDNVQPTATITGNTVFYADWIAATYDVGVNNEHAVESLDTSDFVTTHVFDYNALFNVMSQTHTGSVSAGSHSETWTIHNNGETVPYRNGKSLGIAFVDYDNGDEFSYANNRDSYNISQSGITAGILNRVKQRSGQDLLDLLFNPNTEVIGKYYAGTGNYLFQYMDSTTPNYDGEHDGYYYLDARLNAASYNQSEERFYLYDYLERTSDSGKDGGAGQYSDLLPFNSPYIFEAHQLNEYTDNVRKPGYEYDAKDGGNNHPEYNSLDDATTNYFFGLRTDIEFFLPNEPNTQDEYGNYGNISTRGEHMVFDFHGDDDVWVFVDGQLVLDIGGLHGIMHGRIDFSTGTVISGRDNGETSQTFEELKLDIGEGTHHMTVYYMERGSSQSNCAIYFNIAPRYDLEITKEDIVTAEHLDGAVFSVFDDEAMTDPAELWNSFAEHEAGVNPTNNFSVVNGVAKCWGISAGKTYYIRETTPPPGYPASDDMIRITLNNRGTATIETTTLHGPNGEATEGFAVIKQDVNDTLKVVALTVTNQMEGETTEVRVKKTWDEESVNLPNYITVYLTADGVRIGRSARLTEGNGWSYTWTGLPKHRTEGIDEEIVYEVEEVFVPDYITIQGESVKVVDHVDWIRVDQMSDNKTFLLVNNGKALTYNGSFGWMDMETAKADENKSAHWKVTTDHAGFHLKNELGYTLTYGTNGFYGTNIDDVKLNQVFYYLNSRLMVHDHDVYYQFGTNGSVVQEDGLAFQLYQKETLTGLLTNIINRPVDEEGQTFVEVNKIWSDGVENHTGDSVTIHLYADGKDTGRVVVLSAKNNWQASFDDLPYHQAGTTTKIEYTVVEDAFHGYAPSYSDGKILEGRPVSFWQNVLGLEATTARYRIYAKGYALAVSGSDVITDPNDLEDEAQQWIVETNGNRLVLKNASNSRYLRISSSKLSTTPNAKDAAAVEMTKDGYLKIGSQYLELGIGSAGLTGNAANVDKESLRVTRWTNSTGMEGVGYTITNSPAVYKMPETGGTGTTSLYAFGSLLILAAVLMYVNQFGRKRRKGGV